MPEDTDYSDLIGETYLDAATIAAKVREMAGLISRDYEDRRILLLSILKGGIFFLADLAREITVPVTIDFIAISSYRRDRREGEETRRVRFLKDLDQDVEDEHLLIVEDVIDTGLTLNYIVQSLKLRNPASLEIATLLDRPYRRLVDLPVKYQGFQIPDEFYVGYGFDYRQKLRNLPQISRLKI